MANRKKTDDRLDSTVNLCVTHQMRRDLDHVSGILGLNPNGLLRLMINRTMGHYRLEAALLSNQDQQNVAMLHAWIDAHPGRPIREFLDEYWEHWHQQQVDMFTGWSWNGGRNVA